MRVPQKAAALPHPGATVWRSAEDVPPGTRLGAVAIGVFDGVHRGHQAVVGRAVEIAHAAGALAGVITFDPHPLRVLRPDAAPAMLATIEQRIALLGALGADVVLVLPFTRELAGLSPEGFVEDVLVGALHSAHVVVGGDFRFGYRAAGDVPLLRELGAVHGFAVDEVELLHEPAAAGPRVSSTDIRARLAAGDVEGAAVELGRPHRLEGMVVHGDRRGRELGYPTANLDLPPNLAIPADGIYAGWLLHPLRPLGSPNVSGDAGRRLPAAISIGTNPTFAGTVRRVEAHVLDRDDLELYDEVVGIDFTARLRDTWRFDSVDDLVAQMARDVDEARKLTVDVGASERVDHAGRQRPGW